MPAKFRSVEQELRRIDRTRAAAIGMRTLARTEACLGETVAPTEVIPVVDMERERHYPVRVEIP
jgi:hypothetical protein